VTNFGFRNFCAVATHVTSFAQVSGLSVWHERVKLNLAACFWRKTRFQFLFLTVLLFVSLATFAVSARVWWTVSHRVVSTKLQASPGQTTQQRVPVLRANLTRFGFEPAEMLVPPGRYLLAVRNISGKEAVVLQMKRSNNNQALVTEQHSTGKRHWEKLVELSTGEYLVTDGGAPETSLRLTVAPK
jgi:hypothetical protein